MKFKEKLGCGAMIVVWLIMAYFIGVEFYELQLEHIEEDGEYMVPRILAWLPPLIGVDVYFWLMSVLGGLTMSFGVLGIGTMIYNFFENLYHKYLYHKSDKD
jgi:hypothetical protein